MSASGLVADGNDAGDRRRDEPFRDGFFCPEAAGGAYGIRWFTPSREVDLIGHATLAAGHLVLQRLEPTAGSVRFLSAGAELIVTRQDADKDAGKDADQDAGQDAGQNAGQNAGQGAALALQMPALRPRLMAAPPALAAALGRAPAQVLAAKHYLCVFGDAEEVKGLRPDMARLAGLDLPAVIVRGRFRLPLFCPRQWGAGGSRFRRRDLCLAPYWSARLGKRKLVGRQLSPRGGLVHCEDLGARVELSGNAVIVLEGRLTL